MEKKISKTLKIYKNNLNQIKIKKAKDKRTYENKQADNKVVEQAPEQANVETDKVVQPGAAPTSTLTGDTNLQDVTSETNVETPESFLFGFVRNEGEKELDASNFNNNISDIINNNSPGIFEDTLDGFKIIRGESSLAFLSVGYSINTDADGKTVLSSISNKKENNSKK